MKSKKKILFFGATRFAAEDLIKVLKSKYVILNLSRSKKDNLKNIYFDLKNIDHSINKINRIKNIEYLFFFSSYVPFKEKYSNLNKCFSSNVYSPIDLLSKLKIRPKKIILASSCSIYGNHRKNINENSLLNLENNYSISKYLQENIFRIYCRENSIKFLCLRLGYVYNKNLNKKRIIKVIINKIKNKKKFKVFNQEKLRFNLIHTKDIANITARILIKGKGIFNLVNNEILSLKRMIKIISDNLNKEIKYKNINHKTLKKSSTISSKKIFKRYNIKPKIQFKYGVKDLI